jgi:hypothetical protein
MPPATATNPVTVKIGPNTDGVGGQLVTYTGVSVNNLTGCTGGTGTIATGSNVANDASSLNVRDRITGVAGFEFGDTGLSANIIAALRGGTDSINSMLHILGPTNAEIATGLTQLRLSAGSGQTKSIMQAFDTAGVNRFSISSAAGVVMNGQGIAVQQSSVGCVTISNTGFIQPGVTTTAGAGATALGAKIYSGSGAPALVGVLGDRYLRTDTPAPPTSANTSALRPGPLVPQSGRRFSDVQRCISSGSCTSGVLHRGGRQGGLPRGRHRQPRNGYRGVPIVLGPSVAAAEGLIIDPTSEDATNAQLNINDGSSYVLLAHDYPEPDLDPIYASSADTEGDIPISVRPKNRVVSITVNIYGSSALDLDQKIGVLSQKVGKLNREGGTFKRTTPSGLVIVFDVLPESSMPSVTFDKTYQSRQKTTVSLRFTCKPYGRGPESAGQAFSTTTTGDTSIVIASIGGDVNALGRALITEASTKDHWNARWGVRSQNYSSAASAATAFEAESCTLLGGATVVTLTGSSGGGTNNAVQQATLTPNWQAMLSLQDVGGTYKSHIGDYEVEVRCSRPTSNTGSVSMALEWAEGDFSKITRNDAVVFAANEREGDFVIARLGQVHLSKAKKGTQRWDGRIIAKSTVTGDNLKLDRIRLVPISEGAGEVTGAIFLQAFTTASARDEFDQTAGALARRCSRSAAPGRAPARRPTFAVEATGHTATRTASADSTTDDTLGRYRSPARHLHRLHRPGRPEIHARQRLQRLDGARPARPLHRHEQLGPGAVLRLRPRRQPGLRDPGPQARRRRYAGPAGARLRDRLAAQQGLLHAAAVRLVVGPLVRLALPAGLGDGLAGHPGLRRRHRDRRRARIGQGRDLRLRPDHALIGGSHGSRADAQLRQLPRHRAAVRRRPVLRPQAEIRSDGYIRQDSGATTWGEKTVEGDYLTLPCAGREGRSTELLLRFSQGDPDTMYDPGLSAVSGTAYYTPRYRNIPT